MSQCVFFAAAEEEEDDEDEDEDEDSRRRKAGDLFFCLRYDTRMASIPCCLDGAGDNIII